MNRPIVALALAVAAGCLSASAFAAPGYYTLGHGDVRAYYEGGELKLRYQLDGGAVVNGNEVDSINYAPISFSLSDLIVSIPDVPLQSPDNRFDFTGAAVGESLWFIPEGGTEAEVFGLPWLGFSTEELAYDDFWIGNLLFVDLVDVSGPGYVSMFFSPEDEIALPQVHFATFDGIDGSDAYKQAYTTDPGLSVSTHSHVNWFFTQPGYYDVTLKFSGEHVADGYKEVIGTVRFAVAVVPEPATGVLLGVGLLGCLLRFRKSSHA